VGQQYGSPHSSLRDQGHTEVSEDLETVADLALAEITKRFTDKPDEIPDHVLAKYFTDINKTIDRREKLEEEGIEHKPFSLMDELPAMPVEHAKVLVKQEIGRLRAELTHYEEWLQNANGRIRSE